MRILNIVLLLVSISLISPVFAASADSQPCATIAAACENAGYVSRKADNNFWDDCMYPILLGKTVKNVVMDAPTAKACRSIRIGEIEKELKEFKSLE